MRRNSYTIFVLGIPLIGTKLKESGGFSSAFDSLPSVLSSHFLIEVLAADYLLICHETGSSNPTGIPSSYSKIPFHPNDEVKHPLVALFLLIVWFQIGKGVRQAVYCHPAYLTYMQSTSCEMPGWMKHKLESRLPGEISITSDMQMTAPLWQKVKKN